MGLSRVNIFGVFAQFLDASSHLYIRSCPSVGPSDGRSVGRSVGWMVRNLFFSNAENEPFSLRKSLGQSNIDIAECAGFAGCAKCAY